MAHPVLGGVASGRKGAPTPTVTAMKVLVTGAAGLVGREVVDACEGDDERAPRVNAFGTRNVAEGARRADAHLVDVSTDHVVDGTKASPYNGWDQPNPASVYGRSKLSGERETDPGSTIVRTSFHVTNDGSCSYLAPDHREAVERFAEELTA